MPLTEFQKAFLRKGLISKDQIIDPETGEVADLGGDTGGGDAEEVIYSSAILTDGGYTVDDVKGALDAILGILLDHAWIASVIDRWIDQAVASPMENGTVLNGVTRITTAAPDGHSPYISVTGTHQNPLLTLTGRPEGEQIRISAKAWSPSGGGTHITINVQSGSTTLRNDSNPGVVTAVSQTVTIGANGQLTLSCGWNPAFYDLLIESLGVPA